MTSEAADRRWACLMYHDTPADDVTDYFAVTARALRGQVEMLRAMSICGQTLESLLEGCAHVSTLSAAAAITFDDGYRSNYEVALPILAENEAQATIFVVTSRVGTSRYCTWAELRALQRAGWSIQSHTCSHPFLSQLAERDARLELTTSRDTIEQHLGAPVVTIALPNGDFPRRHQLLAECGYRWVATSRWGANGVPEQRAREIRRYTVRRSTTIEQFTALASAHSSAMSREGVRLAVLGVVRRSLGPKRYNTMRSVILSAMGHGPRRAATPYSL